MDLHSEIMNIPTVVGTYNDEFCYKLGHRDARHAAAELSLKADARIEELEVACKVHAEDCNEAEDILRNVIKQWERSGDVFGAIQQAKEFLK